MRKTYDNIVELRGSPSVNIGPHLLNSEQSKASPGEIVSASKALELYHYERSYFGKKDRAMMIPRWP